mmetsp:Transcript_45029/g.119144  ORF Transcript_45029/g.119144 Transcript_45029/m.119144 type:complete len:329 (-) Transcript_45029:98-1084(-)
MLVVTTRIPRVTSSVHALETANSALPSRCISLSPGKVRLGPQGHMAHSPSQVLVLSASGEHLCTPLDRLTSADRFFRRACENLAGHVEVPRLRLRAKARQNYVRGSVSCALSNELVHTRKPSRQFAMLQRGVLQLRPRGTGIARQRLHPRAAGLQLLVQSHGVRRISQLAHVVPDPGPGLGPAQGLPPEADIISAEGAHRAALEEGGAEVQAADVTGGGAVEDDPSLAPRARCRLELGHQQPGQQCMRELVCLHLHVEAVGSTYVLHRHDASIVGEHVKAAGPGGDRSHLLRRLSRGCKTLEIERHRAHLGGGRHHGAELRLGLRGSL